MTWVRQFGDVREFAGRVVPFLTRSESTNTLPLRIIHGLTAMSGPLPQGLYLAAVQADDAPDAPLLAVALRTPPHNLVLSHPFPREAVEVVGIDCLEQSLPGVIGAVEDASAFATWWTARKPVQARVAMQLGTYELDQVVTLPPTAGRLRPANPADAALVEAWIRAFRSEIMPNAPELPFAENPDHWYFWEVAGEPVTSVKAIPSTPNGATLSAVYTPPALRRRGYATTAVARVSALMLERGYRFCFLFTDLANPTSNGIYQRIGYRYVCEFRQINFTPAVGD